MKGNAGSSPGGSGSAGGSSDVVLVPSLPPMQLERSASAAQRTSARTSDSRPEVFALIANAKRRVAPLSKATCRGELMSDLLLFEPSLGSWEREQALRETSIDQPRPVDALARSTMISSPFRTTGILSSG